MKARAPANTRTTATQAPRVRERTSPIPSPLLGALRIAVASSGGEIVLGEPVIGRIYCVRDGIVWVVAPGGAGAFVALLRSCLPTSTDALRHAITESRGTGRSFLDVLADSGAVDREVLRGILLGHNARQLAALGARSSAHPIAFLPTRESTQRGSPSRSTKCWTRCAPDHARSARG